MMLRMHIAISIFVILLFISHVENKLLFAAVALVATFIPDIDSAFSTLGRARLWRPLQFFVRHRSLFHSLTVAVIFSFILAYIMPVIAFAFFIGYSLHIFADAFTKEGVAAFWPWKKRSSWHLKTGSAIELSLFLIFIVMDFVLFLWVTKAIF